MTILSPAVQKRTFNPYLKRALVFLVIIYSIFARLSLLQTDRGDLLADEAFTGLLATDIRAGYFPLLINEIGYTAPIESYIYAPLISLFGLSMTSLKMTSTLLWLVAGLIVIIRMRNVLGKAGATLAGFVIWLPMGSLLVISFRAYAGYSSGLVTFALMFTVAFQIVNQTTVTSSPWQVLAIGYLFGILIWIHPVFLAVSIPTVTVVALKERFSINHWFFPTAVGSLIGALPLLAWNFKNGFSSFSQPAQSSEGFLTRLLGIIFEVFPRILGTRTYGNRWIFSPPMTVLMLSISVLLISAGIRSIFKQNRYSGALLLVTLLTGPLILAFLNNASFTDDGRYGIIFVVPIAIAIGANMTSEKISTTNRNFIFALVSWMLSVSVPWTLFGTTKIEEDPNARTIQIIEILSEYDIEFLSGYYWEVLPVEYMSNQQIKTASSGHPPVVLRPLSEDFVRSQDENELAFLYLRSDVDPPLKGPAFVYKKIELGKLQLYVPKDAL